MKSELKKSKTSLNFKAQKEKIRKSISNSNLIENLNNLNSHIKNQEVNKLNIAILKKQITKKITKNILKENLHIINKTVSKPNLKKSKTKQVKVDIPKFDDLEIPESPLIPTSKIVIDQLYNDKFSNNEESKNNEQTPKILSEGEKISKVFLRREKRKLMLEKKMQNDRRLKRRTKVFDSVSDEDVKMHRNSSRVINPSTLWKQYWDLLGILLIVYSIFYIPYSIALDEKMTTTILIINTIIDFFYLADTFFCFFLAFYNDEGIFVTNHNVIVLNYIKSWFLFDLSSSIPFDLVIYFTENFQLKTFSSFSKYYRLFKWIRVFRVVKLAKHKKSETNYIMKLINKLSLSAVRLLKFLFFLILFAHITACFFLYIGESFNENNWIITKGFQNYKNFDKYLTSLYFVFTTIITVGYGDITPVSIYEVVYVTFLLSFGSAFFSFAVSAISSFFISNDDKSIIYNQKEEILDQIDYEYRLTDDLYFKIKKNLNFSSQTKNEEVMDLINDLPPTIKNSLFVRMYQRQIDRLIFFENQSYEFITNVIPMLKFSEFQRNDVVLEMGEFVEEMYLVDKGVLSVQLSKKYSEIVIALIKSGKHFGDILMYTHGQSNYNLVAKSRTKILILKKSDFAQIGLQFGNSINEILKNSIHTFKTIERRRKVIMEYYRKNNGSLQNFKLNIKDLDIDDSDIICASSKKKQIVDELYKDNYIKTIMDAAQNDNLHIIKSSNISSKKNKIKLTKTYSLNRVNKMDSEGLVQNKKFQTKIEPKSRLKKDSFKMQNEFSLDQEYERTKEKENLESDIEPQHLDSMNLETSHNLIEKKETNKTKEEVFSLKINDQPASQFRSTKELLNKEVVKVYKYDEISKKESKPKSTFSPKVTPPESSEYEYDIKKHASDEILLAKKNWNANQNKLSLTLKNRPIDLISRGTGTEFTINNNFTLKKSFKLGLNFSPQKTNFSNYAKEKSPFKINKLESDNVPPEEEYFVENHNDEELLESIHQGMAKSAFLIKNRIFEKENLKGILNNQIIMSKKRKDKTSSKFESKLNKLEKLVLKNEKNQ